MSIGEKIKVLRKSKGKTQEELAFDLEVSRQTINKWETDKAQPSIESVKLLCAIFEVSADYFIETDVATSEEQTVDTTANFPKGKNKRIALILCSVIDGIFFLVSALWTVVFGFASFSTKNGYDSIGTDGIDCAEFAVMLILSIVFLVIEILLFTNIFKNRQKIAIVDTNIH